MNASFCKDKHFLQTSVSSLRKQVADHMRSQSDDFLPFLTHLDSDDPYTPGEKQEDCRVQSPFHIYESSQQQDKLCNIQHVPWLNQMCLLCSFKKNSVSTRCVYKFLDTLMDDL